jgi:ankyrin repeat protein
LLLKIKQFCTLGQIEVCKYVDYILKHPTRRFDIDHRDHQEFTPLMSACRANNPPLIGALIDNGADTTVTDDMADPSCIY